MSEFLENAKDAVQRRYRHRFRNVNLNKVKKEIASFPEGQQMLDFIEQQGTKITPTYDLPDGAFGFISVRAPEGYDGPPLPMKEMETEIFVNISKGPEFWADAIYHEAQHLSQYAYAGLAQSPTICPMEDHLWLNRVKEADAQATSVEMKLKKSLASGDMQGFETGEIFAKQIEPYDAILHAFYESYQQDPENLNNGVAKRLAFDAWFSEETYDNCGYDLECLETGISQWAQEVGRRQRHGVNMPVGPIPVEDVLKCGNTAFDGTKSEVNYLDLPGFPDIGSQEYRGHFSDATQKKLNNHRSEYDGLVQNMIAGQTSSYAQRDRARSVFYDAPKSESSEPAQTPATAQKPAQLRPNALRGGVRTKF